jgi:nitrite reductase/ring-hydroxylating ferredoxin subunit
VSVVLLGMDPGTRSRTVVDAGEGVCAVGVALEGRGQWRGVHVARQSDRVLALILDECPHAARVSRQIATIGQTHIHKSHSHCAG